jgi:hypothetical protein
LAKGISWIRFHKVLKISRCYEFAWFSVRQTLKVQFRYNSVRVDSWQQWMTKQSVANQSVQTVNGCHQIMFSFNVINLNIFSFRNKMTHHLKSLIFDCLSLSGGLINSLSTTDREAPDFNSRSTTSVLSFIAVNYQLALSCN